MAKNYYFILGVTSGASPDQIRSAYRKKAKELHPDHHGPDCEPFMEVQEAYETLSDPDRRAAYDRALDRERHQRGPFQEVRTSTPRRSRTASRNPIFERDFGGGGPIFQDFFDSLLASFIRHTRPEVDTVDDVGFEIRVSAVEARRGGRVRVSIPVQTACPACAGWGSIGRFRCQACSGSGTLPDEIPVLITFPGGIRDGFTTRVSLGRLGLRGHSLILRFRITR
jgi:molecular chaperone DnaJ